MFKKLALSAIAVFGISSFSLPTVLAQSSGCSNYWVNPSSGKEECLDGRSLPPQASQVVPQQQKEPDGSVKVFEGRNGDRAYIRLNSIRKFARYGQNRVRFSLTTFYEHMQVGGSVKNNAIYYADCNSYSMKLDTFTKYDANNQIVDSISYNNTSSSPYQSTAPSPVLAVQPNTLGYAAWEYVCGSN
ncbi:hypothetical protein IQ277_21510 [Nostocales cyanobacterium LEGE 12452]|nr:hypothetical protein [Nostocales cyanobacterium LEGE 12452]